MLSTALSLSLAGLEARADAPWAGGPRAAIEWARLAGARAVQLDATAAGLRARELDRSARRDIAALLRRCGLGFSGLDLWIAEEHFVEAARVDRAATAAIQAAELAAELAGLMGEAGAGVVSLTLAKGVGEDVVARLAAAAERVGTTIADHAWPERTVTRAGLGIGIDPAALLLAGADPAGEVARLREAPAAARLSDLSSAGRCVAGASGGRLDRAAYEGALGARGFSGRVVVDVRGLREQERAARRLLGADDKA